MTAAPIETATRQLSRQSQGGRRLDIQGMRAIAVLIVMLSHAHIPGFAGGYLGVDVFFVVSGFLITQQLLSRSYATDRAVDFARFYAARANRIVPMAALVLLATAVATRALVSNAEAKKVNLDALWAMFFGANIHFATTGTDYFNQSAGPSPLQHYWSLAVEEQFYLVWPAMLALLLYSRSRRSGRGEVKKRVVAALLLIISLSLAWSILQTRTDPTVAYFSTLTRSWELGLGGLLAATQTWATRTPQAARNAIGWFGLGALTVACVLFDETTPVPGIAAAVPTLGAVALLWSGLGGVGRFSVGRALGIAPLRYIGDLSYSLYLWHFPVLIVAELRLGEQPGVWVRLALIGLSFPLSVASYHLYESRLHHAKGLAAPENTVLIYGLAFTVVVGYLMFAKFSILQEDLKATAATNVDVPSQINPKDLGRHGTLDQLEQMVVEAVNKAKSGASVPAQLNPAAANLANSFVALPQCIAIGNATRSPMCRLGETSHPHGQLVVLGDSHLLQVMPSLTALAAQEKLTLVPLIKLGCSPLVPGPVINPTLKCHEYLRWAAKEIAATRPDAVIIYGASSAAANGDVSVIEGTTGALVAETAKAVPRVVVLGDVPYFEQNPATCLQRRGSLLSECAQAVDSNEVYLNERVKSATVRAGGAYIPLAGWFCQDGICPAVVGSTVTFLDNGHLTKEYDQVFGPYLNAHLKLLINSRN